MKCENVACGKEPVHCGLLYACRQVGQVLAREGEYVHAEIHSYACHLDSYVAETDNAKRLSRQFGERCVGIAEVLAFAPASGTVLCGVMGYTVGDIQYMREHHLRHALGAVCRNIGDGDSEFARGFYVNSVESCGKHSDILQARKLRKNGGIEHRLVSHHGIRISNAADHVFCGSARIDSKFSEFSKRFPRQVTGIGTMAIQYNNIHILKLFCSIILVLNYLSLYLSPQQRNIH